MVKVSKMMSYSLICHHHLICSIYCPCDIYSSFVVHTLPIQFSQSRKSRYTKIKSSNPKDIADIQYILFIKKARK